MSISNLPPALEPPVERPARVVLLACGNSLRSDDGAGLQIAEAVERAIPAGRLRIIAAQQWTPEMAAELGDAELAIFVDANAADEPGAIRVVPVAARTEQPETHRLDPAAVLGLAETLCGHAPERAFLLTVGADSFAYGEQLTQAVRRAVPRAVRLVANLTAAFAPENAAKALH
jgi:hydrogenase maturation protease